MPTVALVTTGDDLAAAFARSMDLAGLADIISPGHKVLLKPNLHGGHGYTSPEVMRAAILWAFDAGAGEVWIGDGTFWGKTDVAEYFEETGLTAVCDETGAKLLDFHEGEYRIINPDSPDLPETIGFSQHLYDADVVINLPVMKTHFNTLVTLGIKNLKGCLRPIDKKRLHEAELNLGIAAFNLLLKPRIAATVIDATTAYEGMGPGSATPVAMGLLLASEDIVAVDSVACDLMGIAPAQARLIRECAARGLGEMDLLRIDIVGEEVGDHRRRFELPYETIARDFPGLTLHTEHACSGCALNLFRALEIAKQHGQEIMCDTVVIGPDVGGERQALLVGNCTKGGSSGGAYVAGCPPTVDAIRQALTGIAGAEGVPTS